MFISTVIYWIFAHLITTQVTAGLTHLLTGEQKILFAPDLNAKNVLIYMLKR